MKLFIFAAFCLLGSSLALDLENFNSFLKHFGKEYKGRAEASLRAAIFKKNVENIAVHNMRYNRGEETFFMGINQFTDMTEKEYLDYIKGIPQMTPDFIDKWPTNENFRQLLRSKSNAPDSFNWVDEGAVTSVKDQRNCGSCTAFAVTATLETCFYLANGDLFDDLSEQYLIDCAFGHFYGVVGAFGCMGAHPHAYYDFLERKSDGRMQTEASYPYIVEDGHCNPAESGWYNGSSQFTWSNILLPTEEEIINWISEIGPVVATLMATNGFVNYQGGVLNSSDCCDQITDRNCGHNNHAVAVVGYGHDDKSGLDYWLVKNSWGDYWGDNGYIKVKRGTGHCGIFGESASGPTSCS